MGYRLVQECIHERTHAAFERRGEEHALTGHGSGLQNASDDGQEALIRHVVGLVDHRDGHGVKIHRARVEMVKETPGTGNDDLDTVGQSLALRAIGRPTEDRRHPHPECLGEWSEHGSHLGSEFARRHEHETARMARHSTLSRLGESRDHRKGEGEGLARACAPLAEDVSTREGIRQGGSLDGERLMETLLGQCGDQLCGQATISKARCDITVSDGITIG